MHAPFEWQAALVTIMLNILLVEDNPIDAFLTLDAFATIDPAHQVHTVTDGYEAMAFLLRDAPYQHAPRPDIVLLDVNLPGMGGLDVLARVRAHALLQGLTVLVMVGSVSEVEWWTARSVPADGYVIKPVDPDDVLGFVQDSRS